jgi:uncharacterized phiE125 gp8 family phage protein
VAVTVITPPAEEPISLAAAKDHLRVDHEADDGLIGALITAVRDFAEEFQNRTYVTQVLELSLDAWPDKPVIQLPRAPLQDVVSVTYRDYTGAESEWARDNYQVDPRSTPGRLALAYGRSWPSVTLPRIAGITIRYTAGYGAADQVPEKFKRAMLLIIGHLYEHREEVNIGNIVNLVPMAGQAMLWQDKVF